MHSASVFSECSSDEAPQENEFLEFVQTDEKEKLEEINARILKDKRSIQLIKKAFMSKFKPKIFKEEEVLPSAIELEQGPFFETSKDPIILDQRQI